MLWDRVGADSSSRPGGVALCVLYRHKNVVNAKGSKSNHKEKNNSCFAQAEREETVPRITPGVRNRCCRKKAASLLPHPGPGHLPFFPGVEMQGPGVWGARGCTGFVSNCRESQGEEKCLVWAEAAPSHCAPHRYDVHTFRSRRDRVRTVIAIQQCKCRG